MNKEVIEAIMRQTSSSKSTDKLALLLAGLADVSQEKLNKVRKFEMYWDNVDGIVAPIVKVEFFE